MGRIIFITGTDTGVGKTVLTGLVLAHLRSAGVHALAMKPFSTGTRTDARLLRDLMEKDVPLEAVNPFHFKKPLAPLVAARIERKVVLEAEVVKRIRELEARCDVLLVEGAGGLLTPLGEQYSAVDLIQKLSCEVLLVASNRLGVINQVLLGMGIMETRAKKLETKIVLMGGRSRCLLVKTNTRILKELLPERIVCAIPHLSGILAGSGVVRRDAVTLKKKLKKLLQEKVA